MDSNEATPSSASVTLDCSEVETLKREIGDMIDRHGRDLVREVSGKILNNGSNTNVEEQRDQKPTYDIRERFNEDELQHKIESLVAKFGLDLYLKFAKEACFDFYEACFDFYELKREIDDMIYKYGTDLVIDISFQIYKYGSNTNVEEQKDQTGTYDIREWLKEKIGSLVDKFGENLYAKFLAKSCINPDKRISEMNAYISLSRKYKSPDEVASPTPADDDDSERMKKNIKLGEGSSSNPDESPEQRLDFDSSGHGIKDPDQETVKKKKLEEEEKKKLEEDESKNLGKSVE